MTSKEAFDKVKGFILELRDTKYIEYKKYTDILNDLVERDTPMKPEFTNEYAYNFRCSKCESVIIIGGYKEVNFCPECGQRLDWS